MAGFRRIHELVEAGNIKELSQLSISCPILRMRYLLLINDYSEALKVSQTQPVRKRQIHLLAEYIGDNRARWEDVLALFSIYKPYAIEPADLQILLPRCPADILLSFLKTQLKSFTPDADARCHGYLPWTIGNSHVPPTSLLAIRRFSITGPCPWTCQFGVTLTGPERDIILQNYQTAGKGIDKDLDKGMDIRFVVDGANVIYSESGIYNVHVLESLISTLPAKQTIVVLNVRHRKHVHPRGRFKVLWTPRGINDDDYSISLSVKTGAILVSNDIYSDHRHRCASQTVFDIWYSTYVRRVSDNLTAALCTPVWQIHEDELWVPE